MKNTLGMMFYFIKNRRLGSKKDIPFLLGKGRIPEKQREAKRKRLEKLKKRKKK